MKKKNLLVLLSIVAVYLVGCGTAENQEASNTSPPTVTFDAQEFEKQKEEAKARRNEDYVNNFDAQAVSSSIKIGKKTIAFPMKLTDFGSNASFADIHMEDNYFPELFRATIIDDTRQIASARFYSTLGQEDSDGLVYSFEISKNCGISLSLKGITFGSSYKNIVTALGEPSNTNGEPKGSYRVYYENCDDEFLAFVLDNDKVTTISFTYLPPEYR